MEILGRKSERSLCLIDNGYIMYNIMLYLHTSTHVTSNIGLTQQDKGYNHSVTLGGATSISVTRNRPFVITKIMYLFDASQFV